MKAAIAAFAALLITIGSAAASDWVVVKLRGVALQQIDGAWVNLDRGGVVPDDRTIRTLANARLQLQRGAESLELGPDTQISIADQSAGTTTVKQTFGELIVDAEARNVAHFAVVTPYLAAVVKGTRFTVTSGTKGASVKVSRGQVAVEDSSGTLSALVTAGQSAATGEGQPLVVLGANGNVISDAIETTTGVADDVIDDLFGDSGTGGNGGVVGGVLDGVGGVLGGGGSSGNDDDDGESGGLGINVNVPGLGIHL